MLWTFGAERSSAAAKGTDRHGNGWLNLQRSSYLYPISFIPGRVNASPSDTQGGSPVRESRPPGSVRGVLSNGHPYRDSRFAPNSELNRDDRGAPLGLRRRLSCQRFRLAFRNALFIS